MISIRAAAPLLLLVLSGCVTGPDHVAPDMALPQKFSEGSKKSDGDVTMTAWWTAFNDRKLNTLVDQGISQNLDVLQALERINSAEANIVVSQAGALPALDVNASHTTSGSRGGFNGKTPTRQESAGGASISWLLDLFGEYARAKESAVASLESAYAAADVAKLTFLSSVASSYIDARFYQERIRIARANLGSRRETLDLTKLQLEAGAASRLDVVQSEGLVNSTIADLPALETSYRQAVNRIATLLGVPASSLTNELEKGSGQPVARVKAVAGVPADLIRNRPDIRQAERELAAATADIGVAEAQLYPSISLGGSISPSYISTKGANGSLTSWSFGPSLTLPIFDGGRLRANVDIAESGARVQYLAWKSTVLTAVEEVENAMTALNRDGQIVNAQRQTVRSYQEALTLSTASYKDGASSLLDVLDAQRSVTTAQVSLAAAIQRAAQDYVSLSVAIGAGYNTSNWQASAPAAVN